MKRPMHLYLVLCFSSFSALYGQSSTADRLASGSVRVKVASFARAPEITQFSVAAQKTPPVATSEKAYPAELSGTVVDTSGALIPGATVQVRSPNGTVQRTTETNRDGSFTISGLSAGSHQLVISSRGFETKEILISIMGLGTAIASGSLVAFTGLASFAVGFWIKLNQEERLLLRSFPDQYPAYRTRVKALIPYLL